MLFIHDSFWPHLMFLSLMAHHTDRKLTTCLWLTLKDGLLLNFSILHTVIRVSLNTWQYVSIYSALQHHPSVSWLCSTKETYILFINLICLDWFSFSFKLSSVPEQQEVGKWKQVEDESELQQIDIYKEWSLPLLSELAHVGGVYFTAVKSTKTSPVILRKCLNILVVISKSIALFICSRNLISNVVSAADAGKSLSLSLIRILHQASKNLSLFPSLLWSYYGFITCHDWWRCW